MDSDPLNRFRSRHDRCVMQTFQPYPFHWVPAAGLRHASTDARPEGSLAYVTGTSVSTLCRQELSADNSEIAWLWPTCGGCDTEAHRIARKLAASATEGIF
ncbi:zinc finger protein [Saccharopolyspora shandongensis]|uniref:zinc finger protein n=1 Tax=Saccharopolyspora shandongensis TaxID=418495 RepID=UPI0033C244A1